MILFILCRVGVACNQEDDPSEHRRDEQREQNPAKRVAVAVLGHAVSDMDADELVVNIVPEIFVVQSYKKFFTFTNFIAFLCLRG